MTATSSYSVEYELSDARASLAAARSVAVQLEQECAWLREQMTQALAFVEADLSEACFDHDRMEFYKSGPCLRCTLRELLAVPSNAEVILAASEVTE